MSGTEQRGVCAGGKKPTARSINRILKLFESFKIRTAGRKYFFDTLKPAPPRWKRGGAGFYLPGTYPSAAATKPRNSGWGRLGRLKNYGWNCEARKKGCSGSSMSSTSRPSGL